MRTVSALAVTLLAPIGFITTETTSGRHPADTVPSNEEPAIRPTPVPAADVDHDVSLSPLLTVVGGDADQRAVLDGALEVFRDNGLELPDLEIRYSDDRADCGGFHGFFQSSFTPWRVSICTDLEYVPFHELGHAWEAANVDDRTRELYLEARGLETWDGREARWADRGVEDAARIIQQNLTTERPLLHLPVWVERLEAYELLVGRPSPLLARASDVHDSDREVQTDQDVAIDVVAGPSTTETPPRGPASERSAGLGRSMRSTPSRSG